MILLPARLHVRLIAALLLVVACLQAMPAKSVGLERHHGSAFDISSVEVTTAPYQRKADQGEVRPIEPPVAAAVPSTAPAYRAAPVRERPPFGLPPQTGPPLARDIASLALAPRAPPLRLN